MFIKFICCDVFTRIVCDLVSKSPHLVDIEFLPMLTHNEPQKLKSLIQDKIQRSVSEPDRVYDAIILGFGLCGNSIIGLSSPIPLIVPRAHDCCTIHMGCKERFISAFGDILSARWCSTGYYERCVILNGHYLGTEQHASYKTSREYMNYAEQFGEENADYIWETMHPEIETDEVVYIKIDGFEYSNAYEKYKSEIDGAGKRLKIVEGDVSMLKSLVYGEWDDERFLVVPPGKKIAGVYDMTYVVEAGE